MEKHAMSSRSDDPEIPKTTLSLNAELVEEIRHYCEEQDRALVPFIEEILENAIRMDQYYRMWTEAEAMKADIKRVREKAFTRGFRKGFAIALLAAQGKLPPPSAMEELKSVDKNTRNRHRIAGPQIALFK